MKDLIGWCRLHARTLFTEDKLPEASCHLYLADNKGRLKVNVAPLRSALFSAHILPP